jgi:hypothetical protein
LPNQITWHDFALQGYGIPDLITFAWSTQQNQTPALLLEVLRQKLQRQQLTAFELKLRDWRKGLVQAYRYRYFCDSQSLSLQVMLPKGPLSVWNFSHRWMSDCGVLLPTLT